MVLLHIQKTLYVKKISYVKETSWKFISQHRQKIYIPLNRFLLDHTHPIHALEQLQCHSQWWESKGEKLRDTHMHHHFSTLWSECPDPTFLLSLLMHVDHETCLTNPGRKGNTIIICVDEKKKLCMQMYIFLIGQKGHMNGTCFGVHSGG